VARTPVKTTSRIAAICLSLPESEERPFGGHTSPAFRVRDKMFVVISEDRTTMTLKAPEGVQAVLIASDPERFFFPKYVGSKGWVGVRLDLATTPDWDEIAELIYDSYCLIAPKRLVAQWETSRDNGN
jgi:predicted DNA-binding protein (MmcQ/YjbR family)